MRRKRRHPHHVLEAAELAVGQQYTFVVVYKTGTVDTCKYVMGGVFVDACSVIRGRGHDPDVNRPSVEILLDPMSTESVVTVHTDGWYGHNQFFPEPTLIYWTAPLRYDKSGTYFGDPEEQYRFQHHNIVVPSQRWHDDPRVHMLDWSNPDDVVLGRGHSVHGNLSQPDYDDESPADFERRMRVKHNDAMRKVHGF